MGKNTTQFNIVPRNARNRNGTCYTSTECNDRSGTVAGNCAAGSGRKFICLLEESTKKFGVISRFGVCCVIITQSSSATVTQNCTYVQSSGFPSALSNANAIGFTVQKCSNGAFLFCCANVNYFSLIIIFLKTDVCMLRLDFESFTIVGTNGSANDNEGDCRDTFTTTVQQA